MEIAFGEVSGDELRRLQLEAKAQKMGATVVSEFKASSTSHLVTERNGNDESKASALIRRAEKLGGTVVRPEWIEECEKQHKVHIDDSLSVVFTFCSFDRECLKLTLR